MAILESFDAQHTSLPLKDIADRVGLAKPTVFRFVRALEQCGYLIRRQNDEYCLSFRFVGLAGLVDETMDVREVAKPVMQTLARRAKETVTLNTIAKRNRVCIDAVNIPSPLMSMTRPGEHHPLGVGATAKTLMAFLDHAETQKLAGYVRGRSGPAHEKLMKELARIRRQGYAVTYGEQVPGLGAVSAPLFSRNNDARYCISVAGPVLRLKEREKDLVALVVKAAETISRQLAGR